MPRRAMRCAASPAMSTGASSPNITVPARGFVRPDRLRRIVVLPAPFEPISDTMLPRRTERPMPWTTSARP